MTEQHDLEGLEIMSVFSPSIWFCLSFLIISVTNNIKYYKIFVPSKMITLFEWVDIIYNNSDSQIIILNHVGNKMLRI